MSVVRALLSGRAATEGTRWRSQFGFVGFASRQDIPIYLAALMWALRVPLVRAVPIAIVMTLLIHYAFYKLLKVPLPWGLLRSIAW